MLVPNVTYIGPPAGYGTSGTTKKYIAWHNTSNDASPVNEANYAKRRTDNISAHFYADDLTIVQSLDTKYDAWHAGSRIGNTRAIALELVGANASSEAYWRRVIDRIAPAVAAVCQAHNIPARWLTIDELKAGQLSGWCTHDDMRRAWGGTNHTDPGPNFPRQYAAGSLTRSTQEDDEMNAAQERLLRDTYNFARAAVTGRDVDGKLVTDSWDGFGPVGNRQILERLGDLVEQLGTAPAVDTNAVVDQVMQRLTPLLPTAEQVAMAILRQLGTGQTPPPMEG